MKSLVSADIKIAAISYTFAATQTLLTEYKNVRFDEEPLYMMIQKSDPTLPGLETWVIVTIALVAVVFFLGIIIGYCFCCRKNSPFQCVCCCACCECRSCCQPRQTSNEAVVADETPADQIDEV